MRVPNATTFVRKLRGGCQAHLLGADDGRFYVVKFLNNPQHRRVLINEYLSTVLLRHLGIACPVGRPVHVGSEFLKANPDVCIQARGGNLEVPVGLHYGSEFPGDVARTAVFDFLPDSLLFKVVNRADFVGALVFDKWICNTDARQCVFVRTRIREHAPHYADHPLTKGYVALMIDHGFAFGGSEWRCWDGPLQGEYTRSCVYEGIAGLGEIEGWVHALEKLPERVLEEAFMSVPREWIDDETALGRLYVQLGRRRARMRDEMISWLSARREAKKEPRLKDSEPRRCECRAETIEETCYQAGQYR